MTNFIGLTELISNGKIMIIYLLIYNTFSFYVKKVQSNQLETKTSAKIYKKMHIEANKHGNVCTITH